MNRRYIVTLAAIAVVILVAGILGRPGNNTPDEEPQESILGNLSRGNEAEDIAGFIAQRANDLSRFIYHVDELHGSGVVWDTPNSIITTSSSTPMLRLPHATDTTMLRDPLLRHTTAKSPQWILVVAKSALDSAIWTAGMYGGKHMANCAGALREELVMPALTEPFAGAGIFSADGRRLGIVVNCGDRLAPLSAGAVNAWLAEIRAAVAVSIPKTDSAAKAASVRTSKRRR